MKINEAMGFSSSVFFGAGDNGNGGASAGHGRHRHTGKGSGQVELGLSGFWDKDKADEWTLLKSQGGEAAASLAVGLTDTLDLVVGVPYAWFKMNENAFLLEHEDGLSDIAFDVKWRFFEKDDWSLALKPGLSVPSGDEDKGLGAGRAGYRLFFLGTKEFEPFAVHANLGYISNENKFGERLDLWHASIACEFEVLSGLKLMANLGAERPSNSFLLEIISELALP